MLCLNASIRIYNINGWIAILTASMHELLAIYPGISNQSTILMHFYRAALYSIDFVYKQLYIIYSWVYKKWGCFYFLRSWGSAFDFICYFHLTQQQRFPSWTHRYCCQYLSSPASCHLMECSMSCAANRWESQVNACTIAASRTGSLSLNDEKSNWEGHWNSSWAVGWASRSAYLNFKQHYKVIALLSSMV